MVVATQFVSELGGPFQGHIAETSPNGRGVQQEHIVKSAARFLDIIIHSRCRYGEM